MDERDFSHHLLIRTNRAWRDDFKALIADRDAVSKTKHAALVKAAKDSLERFYAEYNEKKGRLMARNKESERVLKEKDGEGPGAASTATVWVFLFLFWPRAMLLTNTFALPGTHSQTD